MAAWLALHLNMCRPGVHELGAGAVAATDQLLWIQPEDTLLVFSIRRYASGPVKVAQRFRDAGAQVLVDFTHPGVVLDNVRFCLEHGIATVVGTSGFDQERLATVRAWLGETPGHVLVAPNFGVGAVLMMDFARRAAPFFSSVEVIELHHAGKVDAPSGTATRTAALIAHARGLDRGGAHRMLLRTAT